MTVAQSLVDGTISLSSPPAIALKILNAVRDDGTSFDNLTDIVKTDPILRVRMPIIVNSSPCGLQNVSNRSLRPEALVYIKGPENTALSFIKIRNYQQVSENRLDLNYF